MFDPKAERPVDPKEEEAVRKFLFSSVTPEVKTTPSISSERRSRPVDPLDAALANWSGSVYLSPCDKRPRLVKR